MHGLSFWSVSGFYSSVISAYESLGVEICILILYSHRWKGLKSNTLYFIIKIQMYCLLNVYIECKILYS